MTITAGDPGEEARVPAHAELSASSSHRWMMCPGSIAAQRGIGDRTSIHAAKGSAAHEIAANCLSRGHDPEDYLGAEIAVKGWPEPIEADREMVDAVAVYVAEMQRRAEGASRVWVEKTFNLNSFRVPAAMYGTSDFVAYWQESGKLLVGDFKFGAGVAVEAEGNSQLRYYALGALTSVEDLPVSEVETVIVQPRAGGTRSATLDPLDLMEFAADLMQAAQATLQPDAPRRAGDWCKFCRAKPHCQELRDFNTRTAIAAFSDDPLPVEDPEFIGPNLIDDETLAWMLNRASVMEDWLRAIREEAFRRMNAGRQLPGWKLVAKQARRKWTDEEQAVALLEMMGVGEDKLFKRTIISPAQAEKLVEKGQRTRLSALVAAVSSGATLAPETDRRPAVQAGMFTDLGDDGETY